MVVYISDTFGPSIIQQLVEGDNIRIGKRSNDIKGTLESLREYKLNVSNKSILGKLNDLGVDLSNAEIIEGKKIYPLPGDRIYLIRPSEPIIKYKDKETLPQEISLSLDLLIVEA